MRVRFYFATLVCVLVQGLHAQGIPTIKYLLPDISTPGLPVVVEFIAPNSNSINNFGGDGLNPPGVVVQTQTTDLIPGPIVVSDSGRVLDVVLFVSPVAPVNNVYQLNVKINGSATGTPQTFFIGNVQHVGTLSGGGVIGSRSGRGTMIIDSMVLNAGTYSVDLSDHDNNELGNQAYLPVTIYSLGPVHINLGATLTISANGKDAGPGGGGGGGRGCDNTAAQTSGGAGFSAGGSGGANMTPKQYAPYGSGTGPNGLALNGTSPGDGGSGCATNGGAGGTAYPFGSGGVGWCSGQPVPSGGRGGGSIATDGNSGGGGAYAIQGGHGEAPNGGRPYGSAQIVPLCGGSGGAAGNPKVILGSGCGGEGGGGGGALMLYARGPITVDGRILANGANGTGGDPVTLGTTGNGGGGAGGAIVLQSNNGVIVSGLLQAIGGTGTGAGSEGRIRIDDIYGLTNLNVMPGPKYSGATLDTLTTTRSTNISVQGSLSDCLGSSQVRIYVQRSDGAFQQNGAVNYYTPTYNTGGCRFAATVPLDISGGNTIFYVSAAKIDGQTATLSNAGALIVRYTQAPCPTVNVDSINFGVVTPCLGDSSKRDTIMIDPKGDTLTLRLAQNRTNIFGGFPPRLNPGARYFQPISFTPGTNGIFIDTLIITDINNAGCPPLRIPLYGEQAQYDLGATPSPVNFVGLALKQFQFQDVRVTNYGRTNGVVKGVHWSPPDARFTLQQPAAFPDIIVPTQIHTYRVLFGANNQRDTAAYKGAMVLELDNGLCKDSLVIPMNGSLIVPLLVRNRNPLDFGTMTSCRDSEMTVTYRNVGNATVHIDSIVLQAGAAAMQFTLKPWAKRDSLRVGDSLTITVHFHAAAPDGVKRTNLIVFSRDNALGFDTVLVTGKRVSAGLSVISSLNFGSVNAGATRIDTIVVRDSGTAPICIDTITINPPFILTAAVPTTLQPGQSMNIIIRFSPGVTDTAQYSETLRIITNCPCNDTAFVTVQARGANGVPSYNALAFGALASCAVRIDSVPIWNAGNGAIVIDSIPRVLGPDAGAYSIVSAPRGLTLAPRDTAWAVVRYDASALTDGVKIASLLMFTTFNSKEDSSLIPLSGTRVTSRATAASPVTFALTLVGLQQQQSVPIVNTGSSPITITGVFTVPAVQFTATAPVPKVLNVGETLQVTVTFRPSVSDTDSTRTITAALIATTSDTCGGDTVRAQLTGRGYNTRPLQVRMCFAQTQSGVIGSIVQIPIAIDTTVPIIGALNASVTIHFDPQVLRIRGATSVCGTTQVVADPTTGTATITLQNCTGQLASGVIATLECEVLIGPRGQGQLSIDSVAYSSAGVLSARCSQNMTFSATQSCSGRLGATTGSNVLEQSRPNPVTAAFTDATIEYEIVADTRVVLRVWDVYGREIARLLDADQQHGRYTVTYDTHALPNGTYYYTVDAGIFHGAQRMTIMR